jgi:hypothetical protein
MGSQAPSVNMDRWHRPRVYGIVVGLYLPLIGAIGIGVWLIPFITSYNWWNPCMATTTNGTIHGGCYDAIIAFAIFNIISTAIIGSSFVVGTMLLRETKKDFLGPLAFCVLIVWSLISLGTVFGYLFTSEANWGVVLAISFFSVNVLMVKFLFKRYPKLST